MNKAAQQLGRLAKGVPKKITEAERQARRERAAKARESRWKTKTESDSATDRFSEYDANRKAAK
jgi:hypothetical protein